MSLQLIRKYFIMGLLISIASLAALSNIVAQGDKPSVYKIADAGVQIDLPPGWASDKDPQGTIVISKKDGDAYVVYSLAVLPHDPSMTVDNLFAAFSERILERAKKDWKGFKSEAVINDSQGGMAVRAQKLTGSVESEGGDVEGLVIVIDSPKPLGIFAQRTKKHSDALRKESEDILASIKKIE